MINFLLYLFLLKVESLNVQLFTSKHCRQCSKFKHKYSDLKIEYPKVKFETLDIRENMELAKKYHQRSINNGLTRALLKNFSFSDEDLKEMFLNELLEIGYFE